MRRTKREKEFEFNRSQFEITDVLVKVILDDVSGVYDSELSVYSDDGEDECEDADFLPSGCRHIIVNLGGKTDIDCVQFKITPEEALVFGEFLISLAKTM